MGSPVPPSPKASASASAAGHGGRPTHLHPIEPAAHHRANSSLPTTPNRSNLGPAAAAAAAAGTPGKPGTLQKTDSQISMASVQSLQQNLQQQQQFEQQQQQQFEQQQQQQSEADNIKVVVRLRPLFPGEAAKGASNVMQVSDDFSSVKVVVPGPGGATMQRDFSFHACLGPETSQADVMALCGIHQLLDAALAGYHVTIFAYGQTGSGKTHTMSGREDVISDEAYSGHEGDGIISRAVQYLFHQIHTRSDAKFALKASYLEVYNEGVFDLVHFSPKAKSLPVKWDASYGFYVQGLRVVPCSQQRTMMEVIRTGMKHRKVGSHRLNTESSRSHAIMTIYCDATPTDPTSFDFGTMRYGKLSFVDLAGSERVKDSLSEGSMLKETININKSLSVLGKVISTLAERDAAGTTAHVPYRDSKLTKLLMDSLGGSALTLMIACASPSSLQVEETLSTLSYATRAKNIHNRPTVQYDPREAQISLLRREIELLRQENALLKEQLRSGAAPGLQPSRPTTPHGHLAAMSRPAAVRIPSPVSSSPLGGASSPLGGASSPLPGAAAGEAHLQDGMARANSNPEPLQQRQLAGLQVEDGSGAQQLRSSLNELELRANAARLAAGAASSSGASGGTLSNSELLRRLRETQGLLIKFSEENGRLARDNDQLQAGRNLLSAEHATVLDEIDLLRGKLSQLERSVLQAAGTGASAAAATAAAGSISSIQQQITGMDAAGAGGGLTAQQQQQQAAAAAASLVNIQALLASLGLGEEAAAGLTAVGEGPLGARMPESDDATAGALEAQISLCSRAAAGSGGRISSARADLGSLSPGADPFSSNRTAAIASPLSGRPSGLGGTRSHLSSATGPGPSGVATAAKTLINRTPLTNKAAADAGVDDSITVASSSALAALLHPPQQHQQRQQPQPAAGSLGPGSIIAGLPGSATWLPTAALSAGPGAAAAGAAAVGVPPSPKAGHSVSFSAGDASLTDAHVYSQLPSSATSTSSAINRPLPHRPPVKVAPAGPPAAGGQRKDMQGQRIAAGRSPVPSSH